MNARVRVYLDQADWQHWGEPQFAEATRQLVAWAADGKVQLAISPVHLIETAGLGPDGYRERVELLQGVAGLNMFEAAPFAILHRGAVALSLETIHDSRQLPPLALVPVTAESLRETCETLGPLREHLKAAATLEERGHELKLLFRHEENERYGKQAANHRSALVAEAAAAIARGDVDTVMRLVRRSGGDVDEERVRQLCELGKALASDPFIRQHMAPTAGPVDRAFHTGVVCHLPNEIRSSDPAKELLLERWQQGPHKAEWAGILAYCAVCHEQEKSAPAIVAGAIIDRWHAVYSAECAIFTCDKRNQRAVQHALQGLVPTRVLRTRQLDVVVLAVGELLGRSYQA